MPAAARFLYGLALGLSLGIIAARLAAATTSASAQWDGQSPARQRPRRPRAKAAAQR